jgi:hypothetical protein
MLIRGSHAHAADYVASGQSVALTMMTSSGDIRPSAASGHVLAAHAACGYDMTHHGNPPYCSAASTLALHQLV